MWFLLLFSQWAVGCSDELGQASTLEYYNRNAVDYVARTRHESESLVRLRNLFLERLHEPSLVLDVGAGPGRDSLYFSSKGHSVIVSEPSIQLARIASGVLGQEVYTHPIQNFPVERFIECFGGVWAMASLIHVPTNELENSLTRILLMAKKGAPFIASFTTGVGTDNVPETEPEGRYFNRVSLDRVLAMLARTKMFKLDKKNTGIQVDDYHANKPSSTFGWINIVGYKK